MIDALAFRGLFLLFKKKIITYFTFLKKYSIVFSDTSMDVLIGSSTEPIEKRIDTSL